MEVQELLEKLDRIEHGIQDLLQEKRDEETRSRYIKGRNKWITEYRRCVDNPKRVDTWECCALDPNVRYYLVSRGLYSANKILENLYLERMNMYVHIKSPMTYKCIIRLLEDTLFTRRLDRMTLDPVIKEDKTMMELLDDLDRDFTEEVSPPAYQSTS